MARKTILIAVLVLGISAFSSARALYRIEVLGGAPVIAQDQPVTRGSVVVFHRHPDGRLTGVPRELVGAIGPAGASGSATPRASGSGSNIHVSHARVRGLVPDTAFVSGDTYRSARPLEPGEMLVIGPTGSGPSVGSAGQLAAPGSSAEKAAAAKAAVETQVFPGDLTTPVSPSNGGSTNMTGTAYGTGTGQPVLNPTLTGAANVANNGATPVLPTGAQSGTNPVGSNGYPTTTTNGAQSGANPIGPNGFPTTATAPQPGGAQPVNPNGFPATNQPAQTNSAPKK